MENKDSFTCIEFFSGNNFSDINNDLNNGNYSSKSSSFYEGYNSDVLSKEYFICKECHIFPRIIFNYDNSLNIKCNCRKIKNLWPNSTTFVNNYSFQKNIEKYLYCKEHTSNKYKYYCSYCKIDICEECYIEKHKRHSPSILKDNSMEPSLNYVHNLIIEINDFINDLKERKKLIEMLINEYYEFPCYNLYKSIKSAKEYLENSDKKVFLQKINFIPTPQIFKIITKENQLINRNNSFPIIRINLSKQNIKDLSSFNGLELKNLKNLILNDNFITNIDPLLKCNFENLENFQLQNNQLNYKSLEHLDQINFTNIKFINLYINKIESIKIFEKILNFKTLKRFDVGDNKFNKEEIFNNGNKKYDLSFLENIGITGNFTDETIHFISNLIFPNLKRLYVSRNNLSSLDFLKNIHCENLYNFWAIQNNLTDYNDILKLEYKDNIEFLHLEENNISNIDNLFDFISKFPKIKELYLYSNRIDLNNLKNQRIIENIRNEFKGLKLIIDNQKKSISV